MLGEKEGEGRAKLLRLRSIYCSLAERCPAVPMLCLCLYAQEYYRVSVSGTEHVQAIEVHRGHAEVGHYEACVELRN